MPGDLPQWASPTLRDQATLYVAQDGSDGLVGDSWGNALATVQKALSKLPARGGVIEVGYDWKGTGHAGFTLAGQAGVTIRGRGSGLDQSVTDNSVPAAKYATMFNSPVVVGPSPVLPESGWSSGLLLERFGISGATGVGLTYNNNYGELNDIGISGCTSHGLVIPQQGGGFGTTFFNTFRRVRCQRNGGNGAQVDSCYTGLFLHCNFDGNTGKGLLAGQNAGNEQVTFIGGSFQRNNDYGANIYPQGGILRIVGAQVEGNNGATKAGIAVGGINTDLLVLEGIYFVGDNNELYGLFITGAGSQVDVRNCKFSGHTTASIGVTQAFGATLATAPVGTWQSNESTDPLWATDGTTNIATANAGDTYTWNHNLRVNNTLVTVP